MIAGESVSNLKLVESLGKEAVQYEQIGAVLDAETVTCLDLYLGAGRGVHYSTPLTGEGAEELHQ